MTRRDTLSCVHEPFGDAFYFGPERLSSRFEEDVRAREESGFSNATYQTIFDNIEHRQSEGKRILIKDIVHYLVPPEGKPATIAPSLQRIKRGVGTSGHGSAEINGAMATNSTPYAPYPFATQGEPDNPTVIPAELLAKFHFTFLIRDPHSSIPSYYRCTIPPLDDVTKFYEFYPSEAGYDEVRRVFDYLRKIGHIGPRLNGKTVDPRHEQVDGCKLEGVVDICVLDADDLLDNPAGFIKAYCKSVGVKYEPEMLCWDGEEHQNYAKAAFEKWKGFHEDAINSTELRARAHKKQRKTELEWDAEWKEKYGAKAAKVIRETVDKNMDDFKYMKQFALKA